MGAAQPITSLLLHPQKQCSAFTEEKMRHRRVFQGELGIPGSSGWVSAFVHVCFPGEMIPNFSYVFKGASDQKRFTVTLVGVWNRK